MILIQLCLSLTGRWDILLFNSGMICCEVRLLQQERKILTQEAPVPNYNSHCTPRPFYSPHTQLREAFYGSLNIAAFLTLLFALSVGALPEDLGIFEPLYAVFRIESPESWRKAELGEQLHFAGRPLTVLAAFLFILQVDLFLPGLKRLVFEQRFPQYLGRISYSLYLVHYTLLGMIGDFCFMSTQDAVIGGLYGPDEEE